MSQAQSQQDSLVGATLGGKYMLEGLLGEGAMGAVYRATTPEGRVVAVKTLLAAARKQLGDEALSRFVREAQVSAALNNPHVVEVIDAGHDEAADVAFMTMELLQGEDLEQALGRTGALRPEVAVRIALQAARGLSAAHAQGIIHRDVKPSNIFLHRQGDEVIVKVCDFGIAKEKAQTEQQGLTVTGSVLGSPLYMSPEQLLNAKRADHRADIWGLAMSLFDAVAGEPALKDISNLPSLVMALARQDVRTLQEAAPWCDPALSSALERALRRVPDQRYATMDDFIAALVPFRGGDDEALREADLASLDEAAKQVAAVPSPPPSSKRGLVAAPAASNQNPERHVGQTIAKRYVLVRLLRQGADGWIYEAKTANSGRPCLLRLIPKSLFGSTRQAEAIVAEARAARDLQHPHLVRVLDAGIDPISTMPYVILEPCPGKPLSELLASRGKLDEPTAAAIVVQIARGLTALHAQGKVHGAVRAGAVHVVEETDEQGKRAWYAQLAWGEGKLSYEPLPTGEGREEVTPLTRAMAPELVQSEGHKSATARTDAWGLSLLLYEALAGRHPLGAYRSMGDLILAICVQEIPKLSLFAPQTPADVNELVGRGLQRNPDKRPGSMEEFERVLLPRAGPLPAVEYEEEAPLSGGRTVVPAAPPRTALSPNAKLGLVVAVLLVIAGVLAARLR